jgi:polyisoprenoid-binding protein YceI
LEVLRNPKSKKFTLIVVITTTVNTLKFIHKRWKKETYKEMKILRNSIAVALITVAVLAIFALVVNGTSARAQPRLDGVTYAPVAAGTYNFDPAHGIIGFGVRHLGIAIVEGRFKDFKGSVNYDEKDVTRSTVEFTAKIDSVDTGVAPRDAHLKTADFFDAAKYPEMSFKSTKVEKNGKRLILTGDLTIKGVTKQVSFPFSMTGGIKDPWGGTRFGIAAGTTINRRDFGIDFGHTLPSGALDVANDVSVELHLEAVKDEPKAGK